MGQDSLWWCHHWKHIEKYTERLIPEISYPPTLLPCENFIRVHLEFEICLCGQTVFFFSFVLVGFMNINVSDIFIRLLLLFYVSHRCLSPSLSNSVSFFCGVFRIFILGVILHYSWPTHTHSCTTCFHLCSWAEKRTEWKFQKTRQTWLLQHIFDSEKVNLTCMSSWWCFFFICFSMGGGFVFVWWPSLSSL